MIEPNPVPRVVKIDLSANPEHMDPRELQRFLQDLRTRILTLESRVKTLEGG